MTTAHSGFASRTFAALALILAFGLATAANPTWKPDASMGAKRHYHTATLLKDGRVLVTGGLTIDQGGTQYLDTAEIYTPGAGTGMGTWTPAASMSTARVSHTATVLPGGNVLVTGGLRAYASYLSSAEVYDPVLDTWADTGDLVVTVQNHAATRLPDGSVLVTGGETNNGFSRSSAMLYAGAVWGHLNPMDTSRYAHTATLLRDGRVLVAGGRDWPTILKSSELYNPATGGWSSLAGELVQSRNFHSATRLATGEVLVIGGSSSGGVLASVERFDPTDESWTTVGSMAQARYRHTSTLLPGGAVLVVGGRNGAAIASTEWYDRALRHGVIWAALPTPEWGTRRRA